MKALTAPTFLSALLSIPLSLSIVPSCFALDAARPEVKVFIDEMVRDHGFEREPLVALLRQAQTRQPILDAISRPAERVVPWFEYRDRFLTEKRIHQGTDFWVANLEKIRRIDDEALAAVVVGILGVETSFGRITGRYRVLDALATLTFDYPPRSEFFRGQLQQFLMMAREESVDPVAALGSYAGAMGPPQFMPSSYRSFAIDADGNGHRDLWTSWADIIGSVANYLNAHGWRKGEPIVVMATLTDADLTRFDTSKVELNETVQSLQDKGVRFETTLPGGAPAMLIVSQGADGLQYRVGFTNFYAITRYNRSTMYAMAVHDLGQAIQNFMRDED